MAVLIKRYANRKLYNTATSRYITLKGIGELIEAGDEVRVPDLGDDPLGNRSEDLIADVVTQGVVGELEPVDVDDQQIRELTVFAFEALDRRLHRRAVRHLGQRVVGRCMFERDLLIA